MSDPNRRLLTSSDIIGALACWAVRQHPFHKPDGLFELCEFICSRAQSEFKDGAPALPMRWFDEERAISRWLNDILDGHPTLRAWNTPKSGHTQQHVFTSRYGGPKPEDDFIDLDALLWNTARSAWERADL